MHVLNSMIKYNTILLTSWHDHDMPLSVKLDLIHVVWKFWLSSYLWFLLRVIRVVGLKDIIRYSFKTLFLHFWWKITSFCTQHLGCQMYCAPDGDVSISKIRSESRKNGNFCVFQNLVCHIMLVFWTCEYYSHNETYEVLNCTYLSELLFNLCSHSEVKWLKIWA